MLLILDTIMERLIGGTQIKDARPCDASGRDGYDRWVRVAFKTEEMEKELTKLDISHCFSK